MKLSYILALSVIVFPTVASAQSLLPLLHSVETNNTQLQALEQSQHASVAEIRSANTLGETSVEFSPFYQHGASGIASSELIVSQQFDFPTLYSARSREGRSQQQVLQLEYQTLRRDILLQTVCLAYDLWFTQQSRSLLEARLSAADSLLSAYELRLRQGEATLIDLNRIRMDRMTLMTECLRCDMQRTSLLQQLQLLNGGQDVSSLVAWEQCPEPIGTTIDAELPPLETTLAQAGVDASNQSLRVAQQGWTPNLTLGYRRDTEFSQASNGFLVGVSLPLFSNSGKVKAARLRRTAAQYELAQVEVEQQNRQQQLSVQILSLSSLLGLYDLSLMEQTLVLLRHAVLSGELPVSDYYIEADRIYSLQQERLAVENDYLKALANLHRDEL